MHCASLRPQLLLSFPLLTLVSVLLVLLAPRAAVAGSTTLSKPPNNLGLVGYWKFDEGTGTQAGDFSGFRNHGTLTNGPTWTTGKLGQALTFDGTNDYVLIPHNAAQNSASGDLTISLWMKPSVDFDTASSIWTLIRKQNGAGTQGWDWVINDAGVDGQTGIFICNGSGCDPLPSGDLVWNANQWYHFVVVFDAVNLDARYYRDGVLIATVTSGPSGYVQSTGSIRIGDSQFSSDFPGVMDEVRLYNRQLSAAEVKQLYGSGAVRLNVSSADLDSGSSIERGLVGHWTFDGKDVTDKVYDRSPVGANGYFIGTATSSAKTIGKLGQALIFDGTNDYVLIPHNAAQNSASGDLTISLWMKPSVDFDTASSIWTLIRKQNGAGTQGWDWVINDAGVDGQTGIFICNGSGCDPLPSGDLVWNANQWYHFVVVFDAVNLDARYYRDGVLIATVTSGPSGYVQSTGSIRIGDSQFSSDFPGVMDEVRLYNRQLSAAEVKQLYKLGTATITSD